MLQKTYGARFHESFDTTLDDHVVYIGPHQLTDTVEPALLDPADHSPLNIGQLLLSPTRTYAPVVKVLLEKYFDQIDGLIHCSGGGQTKCMKYLPGDFRIVKDNLFEPPLIFKLIQESSGSDDREMYQVFNMGHRLEIFTEIETAPEMIRVAESFGIAAKIIGRVEASDKKELVLTAGAQKIVY